MEQRKRPITYAETLEAKKYAEKLDQPMVENESIDVSAESNTSISGVEVKTLPSGGVLYPENCSVYFSPLTFGEMKYLSGSALKDKETIEFFLGKLQTSFDKNELTYFDFFFIVSLLKLATFGETEIDIMYECSKCGATNREKFKQSEIIYEEIRIPFPVSVKTKFGLDVEFSPMTIGNYLKAVIRGVTEDYDEYMAYCMKGYESHAEALEVIKKHFNGTDVNILETIDASFYHGIQDILVTCKHKTKVETGKFDVEGVAITREEVCGKVHNIPFFTLHEFAITTDRTKESLRSRIHFGVQDAHQSD